MNKSWNDLSISEKADVMKAAIRNGIYNKEDIKQAYNQFAEGENTEVNILGKGGPTGYVYDILPEILRRKGLDVRVSSGYRSPKANSRFSSGNKSWHIRHGAVDIVPQGKTTFGDIEHVLYNDPEVVNYMLTNGFGLLDESGRTAESKATMKRTKATGPHFHIGKDSGPAARYSARVNKSIKQGQDTVKINPWVQKHQQDWYNFLLGKGQSSQDASRLSMYFAAQDAFESAAGTSNAARSKNNFGGMQRNGKNIYYPSKTAYMEDKWNMMNNRFSHALSASTIDDFVSLLGDPNQNGFLYYGTSDVSYDPKNPKWQAAQRKTVQDYINGVRMYAGMGQQSFAPSDNEHIYEPILQQYSQQTSPFLTEKSNSAMYNGLLNNIAPAIPMRYNEIDSETTNPYSEAELARQERRDNWNKFNFLMGLLQPVNSNNNQEGSFLNTLQMLTDGQFAEGGPIKNGTAASYRDAVWSGNNEYIGKPNREYIKPIFANMPKWMLDKIVPEDSRGHRDDIVKSNLHPTSRLRGTFSEVNGVPIYELSDVGMQDPNYSIFGADDNNDGHVIVTNNGAAVIPELTITPNGNYYEDNYDGSKHSYNKGGKIYIKPSKRGTFTAAAKKHGKSVQQFASQVLANKSKYSSAMVKKANFARNAAKWHGLGGNLFYEGGHTYPGGGFMGLIPSVPLYPLVVAKNAVKKGMNLYQYGKSYLENKFNGYGNGEIIDLSKKNVSRIKNDTKDVTSILTNDFVERNDNAVRRKKDFTSTTDTLLGDRKIPLSKISTFYGIENGKLKAGPLSIFNDTTTVVPNRAKYIGKIKEYRPDEPATEEYNEAVNNAVREYNTKHGYKPSFMQKIINGGIPFISEPYPKGVLAYNVGRQKSLDIINDIAKKYDYLGSGKAGYVVTENNDTIKGYDLNASPKVLFADESGNALFVSHPKNHVEELNSYLQTHPMYPIIVDNGRYAAYQTTFPNAEIYGGLNRPNDMFIIGTTNAYGGNILKNNKV